MTNKGKTLYETILEKVNFDTMKTICLASIESFKNVAPPTETPLGRYFYVDQGASVLAVAHLDTVQNTRHFYAGQSDLIFSAQLDDRLGAYVILDLLPRLGVNCDILLTEGEESGNSTGAYFDPPKDKAYNWMFQFDRAGHDVVMYQYDTDENRALLKAAGCTPAGGSFSDIASMDYLGVSGFNFGVGYHDNHDETGWASLSEMITMVGQFIRFYAANKDTRLPYVPRPRVAHQTTYLNSYGRSYSDWVKGTDGEWHPSKRQSRIDARWEDDMLNLDYFCDTCGCDCYKSEADKIAWEQFNLCCDCAVEADELDKANKRATPLYLDGECVICGHPISTTDTQADVTNQMCGSCVNYMDRKTRLGV